jgi:hypothetical protein
MATTTPHRRGAGRLSFMERYHPMSTSCAQNPKHAGQQHFGRRPMIRPDYRLRLDERCTWPARQMGPPVPNTVPSLVHSPRHMHVRSHDRPVAGHAGDPNRRHHNSRHHLATQGPLNPLKATQTRALARAFSFSSSQMSAQTCFITSTLPTRALALLMVARILCSLSTPPSSTPRLRPSLPRSFCRASSTAFPRQGFAVIPIACLYVALIWTVVNVLRVLDHIGDLGPHAHNDAACVREALRVYMYGPADRITPVAGVQRHAGVVRHLVSVCDMRSSMDLDMWLTRGSIRIATGAL